MKAKQIYNTFDHRHVEAIRPRLTFKLFVRNAILLTLSIALFIGALSLAVTIIGIIFAIPAFGVGVALFQAGTNKAADIECPNCGIDQEVNVGSKVFNSKCGYCNIPLIVTDITDEVTEEERPLRVSSRDRKKRRKKEIMENRLAMEAKS